MTTTANYTEERLSGRWRRDADAERRQRRGSAGCFTTKWGSPAGCKSHEELAKNYTVYAPSLPGFGVTTRLDWVMNMRDIATWALWALEDVGLTSVNVVGFSLGGWLAAEMATQDPKMFKKMALAAPPGILPPTGEILDMFPPLFPRSSSPQGCTILTHRDSRRSVLTNQRRSRWRRGRRRGRKPAA